ncbi:MAG: hypothetical protein E7159_00180 [Firmicutes bacterium]|nr:hypothetical protein [Bacillota bacterium]
MNKYLTKNISLIIKIFLYLQPVIDLVTSIMINYFNINITLGMIIRMIFLLFIIFFYLFVKKNNSNYKKIYLLSLLLFSITYLTIMFITKGNLIIFKELSNYLKIIYFIILLTLIDKKDIKINIHDLINISIIYLLLILIPNILNISFNSYTQGKIGSVGLFNSGNEISAILAILTPFIVNYIFMKNQNIIKKIILILLVLLTYFQMGSKIVIISLILSIIFNLIITIKNDKNFNTKKLIYLLLSLIIIVTLLIIFIPKTNFYYNIVLHLNYLGINNISDLFTYNTLNRFIFSDRLSFLSITNNYFINGSIIQKLFGLGTIINPYTDYIYIKSIEMDLFDIFYNIGIIGFIIYIIPLIKGFKELNKNSLIIFSAILSIVIAMLVGHTLLAPAVAIYIIIIFKMEKPI